MLLLFSYVSYMISPSSGSSFTASYPLLCFLFYPIFLFFILKHFLYLVGQIRLNPPYPPGKYTIQTYFINPSIDLQKLKDSISRRIQTDDQFKDLRRMIKSNFFISYSCPVPRFQPQNHLHLLDIPLAHDAALYQFLELNLMGLFGQQGEIDQPQWQIFLLKTSSEGNVLIFKYLSEYAFPLEVIPRLVASKQNPLRLSTRFLNNSEDVEWSLSKKLNLMKRLIEAPAKPVPHQTGFREFIKRLIFPPSPKGIRKQVLFTEGEYLERIIEGFKGSKEVMEQKDVDLMFDIFKLIGLFVPYALMVRAFAVLEGKYQKMVFVNRVTFGKEVPGVIRKAYCIDWKEQMFAVGVSEQDYAGGSAVVVVQNESLKKE